MASVALAMVVAGILSQALLCVVCLFCFHHFFYSLLYLFDGMGGIGNGSGWNS